MPDISYGVYDDRGALGQYFVRGATCADKIHYISESDTVIWTTSTKGFNKAGSEAYIASLAKARSYHTSSFNLKCGKQLPLKITSNVASPEMKIHEI